MSRDGHRLKQGLKASGVFVVWQEEKAVYWKLETFFLFFKLGTPPRKIGIRVQYDSDEFSRIIGTSYFIDNFGKAFYAAANGRYMGIGNVQML